MTLPPGYTVKLADSLLTSHTGDVLVGGSPLTALRLSRKAQHLIRDGSVTVAGDASAHLARRLLATNLGHPDVTGASEARPDELTVVIPVRDRAHQLSRTLRPLQGLLCIVVDDASVDPGTIEKVTTEHGATYLPLDRNVGPAAARNAGLSQVTTPYVAFVDSDVRVSAHDLLTLTRHFSDPELALIGPRVIGSSVSARPRWFERYDAAASSLTLGATPSNVRPGAAVAWLPSACLVGRVAALDDGFDPGLRVGEDVDLVWRLVDAHKGVRYDPTVAAYHDTRPTVSGWLGRKFLYGTGGAALAARHGNKIAPAILSPTQAVAGAAILARSRWSPLAAAVALVIGSNRVRAALPPSPGRTAIAHRVSGRGLGWAIRQESALAVRHWWPAAALAASRSRHARRVVLSALVVDSLVALHEQRTSPNRITTAVTLAGRRLDDLAYGTGLWWGAVRAHSARVLLPRVGEPRRGCRKHSAVSCPE